MSLNREGKVFDSPSFIPLLYPKKQKMNNKEKYIIHCPNCKSSFDVSEQLLVWKKNLFEKIEDLIKKEIKQNE
jgi:hypothetical protein